MLKIEDEIDLKELEKFGFKKIQNIYCFENVCKAVVLMIFENRKISNPEDDTGNDVLYDLIKAGYVKKFDFETERKENEDTKLV